MPKVETVANLIQAIGAKDYARIKTIIQQMIAHERYSNREKSAMMLERSLDRWPNVLQMVELPSNIKNFVWPEPNLRRIEDIHLDGDVSLGIKTFIQERRKYDLIHEAGLPVRKSILLAGPPGNGKTSLASALANELKLQFISVRMHTLIDSHMGVSSQNIGKIFEYAMMNDCLLFIDEFDAVGSQRNKGAENSGKEYNNIVTTLLTNIDRFPDTGVLIAATNMGEEIDPALQRRFDMKVWMDNPSLIQIEQYIAKYMSDHEVYLEVSHEELALKLQGMPWSSIEQKCIELHKELILGQQVEESGWYGKQTNLAI